MPNLIDIPTIISTLVTFFATGGSDAAIEAIKGITVNGAMKLAELKDELLGKQEVIQAVEEYQQHPLDITFKTQLEDILAQALEQHPALMQQTAVRVEGDIKADKGSVAAGVISGGEIKIDNTFNDKD